jgi:serine/threonine-protein kinase
MDTFGMGFTDEVSSLQPGMDIGNLHIVSFIGKGAMGEVYLAQHETLGKEFALKVIPKAYVPGERTEAFREAARVQSSLTHPNILQIDDLGDEGMFYWLRLEYVKGVRTADDVLIKTLEDRIQYNKGPLSEDEVRYYLYFLLLGLDHAHNVGVVHMDLKPVNIFIVDDGIKISELGVTNLLGHAWDDFHLLRHEPLLEPTPFEPLPGFSRALPSLLSAFEYYSPEQRVGMPATAVSNLYSIGLITYRMLTGRQCLSLELPSQVVDGLDPRWDAWIHQALAYYPEDRFQSAPEMLHAVPGLGEDAAEAAAEEPAVTAEAEISQ